MTLDEAIKKTEEQCDHFQKMSGYFLNKDQEMYEFFTKEYKEAAVLAKWLRELKKRREQQSNDVISRQAAISDIKEMAERHTGDAFNADRVIKHLKAMPPVQPEIEEEKPVKIGREKE